MNKYIKHHISDFVAFSSFFFMIMQSCFLTLFQGLGWVACTLIFLVNFKRLNYVVNQIISSNLIFILFAFWIFSSIKSLSFQWVVYMTFVFIATAIILSNYLNTNRSFINDLYKCLIFVFYYSIAHVFVLIFFHNYLIPASLIQGIQPHTFLYLLFFNYSHIDGVFRIQGFTWEPGIWQLFLNLFFYLSIIARRNITTLLLTSICIYYTHSTTGYILLILNWCVYIYYSKYKTKIIPFIIFASIITVPMLWSNITSKFSGDNQVSGLARVRDLHVGYLLITEYPLFGINPNTINNIPEVSKLKEKVFYDKMGSSANELNTASFIEDGFLNGFLTIFLDWGVAMGTFIIISFCRSPLINDRKTMLLFALIVFLSMTAEPISRTIFFYIFPFSSLLLNSNNLAKYNYDKNFNNNSNIQRRKMPSRMFR